MAKEAEDRSLLKGLLHNIREGLTIKLMTAII